MTSPDAQMMTAQYPECSTSQGIFVQLGLSWRAKEKERVKDKALGQSWTLKLVYTPTHLPTTTTNFKDTFKWPREVKFGVYPDLTLTKRFKQKKKRVSM